MKVLLRKILGLIRAPLPWNAKGERFGHLSYQCNICGSTCETSISELDREKPSCDYCGSTVRARALIHLLSIELFGKSLIIRNFPKNEGIVGIGMSDWMGYASPLRKRVRYTNTFYHQDPKLDITNVPPSLNGTLDFVISSDVFEHVPPPVSLAFENAYRLLKPDGVIIFTVPYTKEAHTREHFPELYDYKLIKEGNRYFLKNRKRDDTEEVFNDLIFHGGPGSTLEMRVFSEASLMEEFHKAGFREVNIRKEPAFERGIYWHHDWSLPITARK